jgi:hypothetical protein
MTAKRARNLGGSTAYRTLRWFNPKFDRVAPSAFDTMEQDFAYRKSDEYVFDELPVAGRTTYDNSQFMAMASCTARGSENLLLQPLTMYSEILKPTGFGYSRPQLINVYLDPFGVTDSTADDQVLWH